MLGDVTFLEYVQAVIMCLTSSSVNEEIIAV
jgi:hypothetical protein